MGVNVDDVKLANPFHALEHGEIHGAVPTQDHRHGTLALDDPDRFPEVGHGTHQVPGDIIRIPAVHHLPFVRIHVEFFPFGIVGAAFFVGKPGGTQTDSPGPQPAAGTSLDGQVKRRSQDGDVRIQVVNIRRQVGFGKGGNARRGHIQRFLQAEVVHVQSPLLSVLGFSLLLGPL